MLRTLQSWPSSVRLAITGIAVGTTCLLQLPIENEVPGEPFLLFLVVVVASTLAFGAISGLVSVASTTILSIMFFEPYAVFTLRHAADLIKIELYAMLASCSVVAFARLGSMLIAEGEKADRFMHLEESKSMLLREMAHGVANNFSSIAAFVGMKSITVRDAQARSVLDETAQLIRVMARVHGRLRERERDVSLGSQTLLEGLCADLKTSMARDRPISIECEADDRALDADQAISLGLIVNELVTNAIKHAFPNGRGGCIRVGLDALGDQLRLVVEDDGTGFDGKRSDAGIGQELVRGLSRQLGGDLETRATKKGSSFHLSFPYKIPGRSVRPHSSAVIH